MLSFSLFSIRIPLMRYHQSHDLDFTTFSSCRWHCKSQKHANGQNGFFYHKDPSISIGLPEGFYEGYSQRLQAIYTTFSKYFR